MSIDFFAELFATGRVAHLILTLLALETLVLVLVYKRTGRGIEPVDLIVSNLAGVGLVLALHAALTGAAWMQIAPWLLAAFAAHIVDIVRRWRNGTVL
jgi:hypothetical protein